MIFLRLPQCSQTAETASGTFLANPAKTHIHMQLVTNTFHVPIQTLLGIGWMKTNTYATRHMRQKTGFMGF